MDNEQDNADTPEQISEENGADQPKAGESLPSVPYTRKRAQHRRIDPIDDFLPDEESLKHTTHDSNFTMQSHAFSGRAYRRSQTESKQLRRNLHYGQYLEIPKGRRDIFVSRERKTRLRTALALIVVLVVLALVIFFVWEYMQANWGAVK